MRRREFLSRVALGAAAVAAAPRLLAQGGAPAGSGGAAPVQGTTSNLFDLNQEAAKTVRRAPKPRARASMSKDERDALEHEIRCQCGCTLDVYTCRTTDFSCQVSPAMHRDVLSLVEGGYSAQEILDAFVQTYGERALMSPKREGFNWAGYLVPFAALGAGAAEQEAVVALREIEFDRVTGKLSDGDYDELRSRYTERALDAMRRGASPAGSASADDAVEAAVLAYRSRLKQCANCGPRPEPDAIYCSTCGHYLPGACDACGWTVNEPGAAFCASCGRHLAAA